MSGWRGWLIGAVGVVAVVIAAFTAWLYIGGPWRAVDFNAQAPTPQPALLAPNETPESWRARRAALQQAFEDEVYGAMPATITPIVASKEDIPPAQAGGVERVEQWRVEVGAAGHFNLAIGRPPGDTPVPVIIVLDFCGNQAAFPNRPEAIRGPVGYIQDFCLNASLDPLVERVFGKHVNAPPFAEIAARGYAVAVLYAGDIVPDGVTEARTALDRFAPDDTGALMAWAWTASRAYDVLAADPRFDAQRIALWGQSRQGKTALVAAAFDERFGAVIALQSGRGGDAPSNEFAGETRAQITGEFPHWFSPAYAARMPSVEQHQLLALIAPRPLLLGHAARDEWADPVGAITIGDAAAPAFVLLGGEPTRQFTRPGGHGIHERDWQETLNFLDAHWRR